MVSAEKKRRFGIVEFLMCFGIATIITAFWILFLQGIIYVFV